MVDRATNSPVAGSRTWYRPFGGYRGSAPSQTITDRDFTGQKENMEFGLLYYNARYYLLGVGRFISADTLVPDPTNPQAYNRYAYSYNKPLNFIDPDGHDPAPLYQAVPESCAPPPIAYYLNGLGGQENISPRDLGPDADEYSYLLYMLQEIYGEANVHHIPVFTDGASIWPARAQMVGEALGSEKPWTNAALEFILANPPASGQQVVIVGSSAGGTVAVELLKLLKDENIFVDTLILRGSFVREGSLTNVGEVHYLAGDPPFSDIYYSFDTNPFDDVKVQRHIVPGLTHHAPNKTDNPKQALQNIGALIVDILVD